MRTTDRNSAASRLYVAHVHPTIGNLFYSCLARSIKAMLTNRSHNAYSGEQGFVAGVQPATPLLLSVWSASRLFPFRSAALVDDLSHPAIKMYLGLPSTV